MVNLRVCAPEATENYIQNPAFRYNTNGWTTVGATLTRTLDYARFNIASGQVVTNGAALGEGVYYRVSSLSGISDVITVSVYLRGGANGQKIRLRLQDDPTGFEWTSDVIELTTKHWKRVEVSGRCTGGNDIRLKVETADQNPVAYTFYVDGAQMERKAYSTTYCDGDQEGCRWNIVNHGSNSIRTADTRAGGRWVALAGPCRPNNDIYVTVLGGFGAPPVENNIQPWSQSPGSYFQNQKILDRVVTLQFTVKKEGLRLEAPASLAAIHDLRQQLVDLFKTDVTLNDEAFLFEYSESEGDKPLYMRMRYEAGLEGQWDVRNGWFNTFAVRLIAVDPLWSEDNQEVKQLAIRTTYNSATAMEFWKRQKGEWLPVRTSLGVTPQDVIYQIIASPDGSIYACGNFSNDGMRRIVRWDGSNFVNLGPGATNGDVISIDIAPDGTVYAGGAFTTIGGVAATRVAKYNPVTDTWSAMGAGLNGNCAAICVAPNGQVYAGGSFTTAGGIACFYIARWDGLQWRTVGATSGFSNTVKTIVNAKDGKTLYVGGGFTTDNGGGVTYNRVASVDITTNLISPLGYGFGSLSVLTLAIGLDGAIYAGGDFQTSGAPGTPALLHVAKYSGGLIWLPLGSGLTKGVGVTGQVNKLGIGNNGELYAVGDFTLSGSKSIQNIGKWIGDAWHPLEFYDKHNATPQISSVFSCPNGDLYIGLSTSGGAAPYQYDIPALTTVVNPGSASCWPKIYITGQGTLQYISNIKTGQEIFLNLPVFAGEEIFIDPARGKITGTVRGDLSWAILPGSEIRSIYLLPGENKFSILVTEDVNAGIQMEFTPQDWSADAVIDAQAMV